ncbi:MAG: translation initiation factor IF-2, partial [Kiritimatiellia bacterium]
MRVFELAKKLEIPNKELIELIEMEGIEVQTHFSVLTDEQVIIVTQAATGEAPEWVESPAPAAGESDKPEEEAPEEAPVSEPEPEPEPEPEEPVSTKIEIFDSIVVKQLAELLDLKPNMLIASLMKMGVFASITQTIDKHTAKKLAEEHGFEVLTQKPKPKAPPPPPPAEGASGDADGTSSGSGEDKSALKKKKNKNKKEKDVKKGGATAKSKKDSASGLTRPPVVTFMGHVDHGKTSLLDKIRKANVVAGEAGGITQHIGAYTVEVQGKEITFLDTPGHAAFSAMRSRGADLTDIVVIVISADESFKPQTVEAIKHARDADVTLMVAVNKIDLPNANVDRVYQDMQKADLTPEAWGGEIVTVPVSAETGEGLDTLLEMILLQAEILELVADPSIPAVGYVIESEMEKGMGATASVLITEGTLHQGDVVLCGETYGKLKALIPPVGGKVKSAGPSHAVKLMGLSDVPTPGDRFEVLPSEKDARNRSEELKQQNRMDSLKGPERGASLDDLFAQAGLDDVEELVILLKSDVKGSQEAIVQSLLEIKSEKVRLKFVGKGIGPINENDVLLASASNAIIIGFNVPKENVAVKAAKRDGVEIRLYDIIYELIDEVRAAMLGLLQPVQHERVIATAEIRAMFKLRKKGNVAGCVVTSGRIRSNSRARVLRGKDVIYQGTISTLKRFQDEVKEVGNGQECGIKLQNFDAFEVGDVVEVYVT